MTSFILILVLSYLVGSIPTSILAARWLRGIDIRQHGSGNAGATNVFRVLGKGPGAAVMLHPPVVALVKGLAGDPGGQAVGNALGTPTLDAGLVQPSPVTLPYPPHQGR